MYLGYTGTDAAFDFGRVYGTTVCDERQVRQVRVSTHLTLRAHAASLPVDHSHHTI